MQRVHQSGVILIDGLWFPVFERSQWRKSEMFVTLFD